MKKITTNSDLSSYQDGQITTDLTYDGLGRTIETRKYAGTGWIVTSKVTFDGMGRVKLSYNPYGTTNDSIYGWTETSYDALSRVTSVTSYTGSGASTGTVQSSYSGNQTTVTDQAGKVRRSTTDALGRLVQVVEDPNWQAYLTSYSYDALDNLTTVTQGSQTRTFAYDSLKRLTSATNPESGTTTYQYDENDNLTQKTDARSITTNYSYDGLNRITQKSYSDGTATVNYYYDNQAAPYTPVGFSPGFSIDRLVAVTINSVPPPGVQRGNWYGYGRAGKGQSVLSGAQCH